MKITFEVPDNTVALSLTGVMDGYTSYSMATKMVETYQLEDGAEIVCDWKGGGIDET